MRIKILQKPNTASIDGIRLDRFRVGQRYEVGHLIGALLLAEGWAEPVDDDTIRATARSSHQLIRDLFPPYYSAPVARAAEHRRRPRRSRSR